jgi:uncharacterized membrane protein YidH (DUF202 family)
MKVWGRSGLRPDDEPHAASTTTADSPAGKQEDSAASVERSDVAQSSSAGAHDDSAAPESSNTAGMHEDSAGTPQLNGAAESSSTAPAPESGTARAQRADLAQSSSAGEDASGSVPNDGESVLRSALSVVTAIGPPLTIATALMIYFGWARTNVQARAMGLDVSLFRYSTQDYVLSSISTLFVPLLVVAALALGGLALHRRIGRALRRPAARPALRTAGRVALTLGLIVSGVAVLIAFFDRDQAPLIIPLALAVGTAVAAYGGWLAGAAAHDPDAPAPAPPVWQSALRLLLVGSVITLALFWEVSNFAGVVGRGYAQQTAATVSRLPRVTAFSTTSLGIEAPGVREERIAAGPDTGNDAVRYRTTGLRFLASSGGRIFLLHDGWKPRGGTVIVLPDNEQVRWQFSR